MMAAGFTTDADQIRSLLASSGLNPNERARLEQRMNAISAAAQRAAQTSTEGAKQCRD